MARYREALDPYWMLLKNEETKGQFDHYANDDVYLTKLRNILSSGPYIGVPYDPTVIARNVFIGSEANAENLDLLKRFKITHVLNLNGFPLGLAASRRARYRGTGIIYEEMAIEDSERCELGPYIHPAHTFIDNSKYRGRVLIADSGVSRVGAIAITYLMRNGLPLLEAAKMLKTERRVVLCNNAFMEQVVAYARMVNMLDPDLKKVYCPTGYGRALDRPRITRAHLPFIL